MKSYGDLIDEAVAIAPIGTGYNWRFRYLLSKRGLCIVDWDGYPLPDALDYPIYAPLPDYSLPDAWPLAALIVDVEDAMVGKFGETFVPRTPEEMSLRDFYDKPTNFKSQGGHDRLVGSPRTQPSWLEVETSADRGDLAAYFAGWDTVDLILDKVLAADQAAVWDLDVEEGHRRFWVEPG